jgi:phenylpyruvate tautomerase PptA (4-oxalocrotonate tautomerase family)
LPYLQIDLNGALADTPVLAAALARAYGEIMEADEQRISVAFRQGDVLRCFADGPRPVTVVTCDIRAGRPPERLERLAGEITRLVAGALGGTPDEVVVYFTQHAGFEIFRDGAPSADWGPMP